MTELIAQFLADPFVTSLLLGLGVTVVGVWLAACWWAYRDAERRTGGGVAPFLASAWVFLSTPVMLPLSIGVYTLVRPQEAAGDRRVRGLLGSLDPAELEEPSCPACAATVDPEWRRCPACATWLGLQCDRCERWAPRDAEICPWCAWVPGESTDAAPTVIGTASRPLVPAIAAAVADRAAAAVAASTAPAAVSPAGDAGTAPLDAAASVSDVAPAAVAGAARRLPSLRRPRPVATTRPGQQGTPGGRRFRDRGSVGRTGGPVEV